MSENWAEPATATVGGRCRNESSLTWN